MIWKELLEWLGIHDRTEENLFTREIPISNGKRFVIPDVHGCSKTLEKLISKINLQKNDQLFFLGDYIDKGDDSKGVLDLIFELRNSDFQIFPLRGNHEELLLESLNDEKKLLRKYIKLNKLEDLFDKDLNIKNKYFHFLTSLPFFYELENCFLVHGGFDFLSPKPFENHKAMTWIRNFKYDPILAKNKCIVHGHTPTEIKIIEESIQKKREIIPLDNGCFRKKMQPDFGNLLCLELNSWELFVQNCLD